MAGDAVAAPASDGLEVYRRLRDAITSGRFQPNERLVEGDLAAQLHAGRTAVRAALVRLDQEGLVVREPYRGARVRLVSDREALEIEEVRVALEQLIVRHAARNVTEPALTTLRETLAEMRRRVERDDPLGYSELNAQFHQQVWAIADHPTAEKLLRTLKSQSIRFQYRTILRPGRTARSLGEHEAIVEALASGDPDAAEAAMREHLGEMLQTLRWAIESHRRHPDHWLPA